MRVKVEVTATDIRLGKRGEPSYCALARAFKRVLKPGCHVSVINVISIHAENLYCVVKNTAVSQKFVVNFDTNKKLAKPTTMTFDIPKEVLR